MKVLNLSIGLFVLLYLLSHCSRHEHEKAVMHYPGHIKCHYIETCGVDQWIEEDIHRPITPAIQPWIQPPNLYYHENQTAQKTEKESKKEEENWEVPTILGITKPTD